jgi:hypothetical protein
VEVDPLLKGCSSSGRLSMLQRAREVAKGKCAAFEAPKLRLAGGQAWRPGPCVIRRVPATGDNDSAYPSDIVARIERSSRPAEEHR